jgi:hypothetical protein
LLEHDARGLDRLVAFDLAIADQPRAALHDVERRAELVRDARCELADRRQPVCVAQLLRRRFARAALGREPIAHQVDLLRELAELVALREHERPGEVAGADAARFLGELRDRPPDEDRAEHEREQAGDQHGARRRDDAVAQRIARELVELAERLRDLETAVARLRHLHRDERQQHAGFLDAEHLAFLERIELLARDARRIAARRIEPHPARADVLAAARCGEQELAGGRLAVALPDLGHAARERAPERRRLGSHLVVEHVAFAPVVEEPLDHRDQRNADDERGDELTGQSHEPAKR